MTDILGDRRHWREFAEHDRETGQGDGVWADRAIRALDRVELLELEKRNMEDAQMRLLMETMSDARLAWWADTMANAVHNAGMAPKPVQDGKYRVSRLPFPTPRGN